MVPVSQCQSSQLIFIKVRLFTLDEQVACLVCYRAGWFVGSKAFWSLCLLLYALPTRNNSYIVLSCPVFVSVCLIMCNFIGLNPRLRTHVFMFRRRMCVYTGLKFYPNNLNGVKF